MGECSGGRNAGGGANYTQTAPHVSIGTIAGVEYVCSIDCEMKKIPSVFQLSVNVMDLAIVQANGSSSGYGALAVTFYKNDPKSDSVSFFTPPAGYSERVESSIDGYFAQLDSGKLRLIPKAATPYRVRGGAAKAQFLAME